MHNEMAAAGVGHGEDEALEVGLGILVVDADAALDRDRDFHRRLHGRDTGATSAGSAIRQAPKLPP